MDLKNSSWKLLRNCLEQKFKCVAPCNALNQFQVFLKELQIWGKVHNLTSILTENEIILKHFLDSLSLLPYLANYQDRPWLDVASGAGFPGLPLAIALPKQKIQLLEPSFKRVAFLQHIIRLLDLKNLTVANTKFEMFSSDLTFSAIISRAFCKLDDFLEKLEYSRVALSGSIWLMKGKHAEEEIMQARSKKSYRFRIHEVTYPGQSGHRQLIEAFSVNPLSN